MHHKHKKTEATFVNTENRTDLRHVQHHTDPCQSLQASGGNNGCRKSLE